MTLQKNFQQDINIGKGWHDIPMSFIFIQWEEDVIYSQLRLACRLAVQP